MRLSVLLISISRGSGNYAQALYIYGATEIIPAILCCRNSCDCNNDEHDRPIAVCLWNPKNHCCENNTPSLFQSFAEVSAAFNIPPRPVERSQLLDILAILKVKSCSILNALRKLQVLPGEAENAYAESASTVPSSSRVLAHLEELENTGEIDRSIWEIGMGLLYRITSCRCIDNSILLIA